MKKTLGIISIFLVLIITLLGMNLIWKWVTIDINFIIKVGISFGIISATLLLILIIWYVFMKKSKYHPKSDGNSRVRIKDE